jgi:hypothetical protein
VSVRSLPAFALVLLAGADFARAATGTPSPTEPPAASAATGAPGTEAPRTDARGTNAPGAEAPGTAPPAKTCELANAYFTARLRGAIEREVRWRAADMGCEGMNRPDGRGLRVAFEGRAGGERLTFVLGMPRLAEGTTVDGVPVNLTVIREGGAVYGTRGEGRCTLDHVQQQALDVPPTTAKPRRWRIEARGFCLEPARMIADGGRDAILVSTFDFAGHVTWEPDPSAAAAAAPSH